MSSLESARPRTALVAGGTGVLGSALVALLLDRGERVAVPWIVAREADVLADRHRDAVADDRLRLSQANVTDMAELGAFLDIVRSDWGPLWLACSAVGGWAGGVPVSELADLQLLDQQMRLNLYSAFSVAAEGLRHMGSAGGRVVLVGSRTVVVPAAGQAAYTAAKAGVHALVQTLARELRGTGRTANAVVPGVIDTPANRESMPDADYGRWVPPRQVAEVMAWLGSPDAWSISGAMVPVYGDS